MCPITDGANFYIWLGWGSARFLHCKVNYVTFAMSMYFIERYMKLLKYPDGTIYSYKSYTELK